MNLVWEVFSISTTNTAPLVKERPIADAVNCARVAGFAAVLKPGTRYLGHSSWAESCGSSIGETPMSHEIPGKITQREQVSNKSGMTDYCIGTVEFGNTSRPIDLDLVPDAQVGDYVLVQGGFAVGRIGENEAKRLFEELTLAGMSLDSELDGGLELERRQKPHPKG